MHIEYHISITLFYIILTIYIYRMYMDIYIYMYYTYIKNYVSYRIYRTMLGKQHDPPSPKSS